MIFVSHWYIPVCLLYLAQSYQFNPISSACIQSAFRFWSSVSTLILFPECLIQPLIRIGHVPLALFLWRILASISNSGQSYPLCLSLHLYSILSLTSLMSFLFSLSDDLSVGYSIDKLSCEDLLDDPHPVRHTRRSQVFVIILLLNKSTMFSRYLGVSVRRRAHLHSSTWWVGTLPNQYLK